MSAPQNRTFGPLIDYEGYTNSLDAIGRIALPKAAAGMLNNAAFAAQKRLTEHALDVFDRPNAFTEKAFIVQAAKPNDRGEMASAVFAKDFQAQYLYRQIVGGTRKTGDDRGSGQYDLFAYARREDKYGGIPKRFLKALSAENKKEKAARAAAQAAGTPYTKEGGIFFGVVGGVKGYWRRPKRPKAANPRKKGMRQTRANVRPTLLLAVADTMDYKVLFKYNEVIAEAYREFGAEDEFRRELNRQIDKLLTASANGPTPPPPTPPPTPPTPPAPPSTSGRPTGFRRPLFLGGSR